ncbi:MAG: helix-turn-helix domain-containing protein [Bacteroidota bacterium]
MSTYALNELAELAANYINTTDRHIFLTGKAGTGKTTFLRHIVQHTYKNTVVAAPTGIAAINAGGVTLHSLLQLPFGAFVPDETLPLSDTNQLIHTPRTVRQNKRYRAEKLRLLREMELLIIDEVSMLRADVLDCMDCVLRSVRRQSETPFGGLQLLFIGDLMQLPPVVKTAEWTYLRQHYRSAYFFEAHALRQNPPLTIELQRIYRQNEQDFIDILNRLRHNQQTDADIAHLNKYFRPEFKPTEGSGYIYLTTHNYKADQINQEQLHSLPSRPFSYEAEMDGDFPQNLYPISEELQLKVGAQVMFIKNDTGEDKKFFNGKIGTVSKLEEEAIYVKLEDGDEIDVELHTWENQRFSVEKEHNEVVAETLGTFKQYPLKLAWAVTIHKSQGLTFEKAVLDMASTFAPGQLYVALSRLTSLDGLVLASPIPSNPPDVDRALRQFIDGFLDQEGLENQLQANRVGFLWKFAQRVFGFETVMRSLGEHSRSFDKEEKRSRKQQFFNWTKQLIEDTKAQQAIGEKFIGQIAGILHGEADMTRLAERSQKAWAYFEPQLWALTDRILKLHKELKGEKQVKTYREELKTLSEGFIAQMRELMKFTLLAEEQAKGEIPSKASMRTWEESLQKRINPRKRSKEPTAEVSFKLYQAGKRPEEIAAERDLKTSTILGHLAHYVRLGEIDVMDLIPAQRLKSILPLAEQKGLSSKDIKDQLDPDYTYQEIRLARAYLESIAEKEDD